MNVFELRARLIGDYASFVSSFINIRDPKIRQYVEDEFVSGTPCLQWRAPVFREFREGQLVHFWTREKVCVDET